MPVQTLQCVWKCNTRKVHHMMFIATGFMERVNSLDVPCDNDIKMNLDIVGECALHTVETDLMLLIPPQSIYSHTALHIESQWGRVWL